MYFSSYQQRRVSCHPGDLSRKCHLCHGSCKSQKRGTRPSSSHYKTVRNIFYYFVSQQTELTQSETPPTSITFVICKGTWSINQTFLFETFLSWYYCKLFMIPLCSPVFKTVILFNHYSTYICPTLNFPPCVD